MMATPTLNQKLALEHCLVPSPNSQPIGLPVPLEVGKQHVVDAASCIGRVKDVECLVSQHNANQLDVGVSSDVLG